MLRSENVLDDEVVGEAGEFLARGSIAAALALFLSRACFFTGHRVERQTWMVSCAARMLWLWISFVLGRYENKKLLETLVVVRQTLQRPSPPTHALPSRLPPWWSTFLVVHARRWATRA